MNPLRVQGVKKGASTVMLENQVDKNMESSIASGVRTAPCVRNFYSRLSGLLGSLYCGHCCGHGT